MRGVVDHGGQPPAVSHLGAGAYVVFLVFIAYCMIAHGVVGEPAPAPARAALETRPHRSGITESQITDH